MKTKQEIRTLCRQQRKELNAIQRDVMSKCIANHYMQCVAQEKPIVVHLFLPIEPLLEINTLLILKRLNTAYPKVKTVTSIIAEDQQTLLTVELRHDMPFIQNSWGIAEPEQRLFCDAKEIDEVLTPLLAVDQHGFRVGYGKGFYDRFFMQCEPSIKKTGLNYFKPVSERLPNDDWDVPLTRLISPDGVLYF